MIRAAVATVSDGLGFDGVGVVWCREFRFPNSSEALGLVSSAILLYIQQYRRGASESFRESLRSIESRPGAGDIFLGRRYTPVMSPTPRSRSSRPPSAQRAIDRIASDCLAYRLRLASRRVSSIYDAVLKPHDLKVSQLNVLVVTGRLGDARPAEACRALQMDKSTLSRHVERLAARGLIEILEVEGDARTRPFRLSKRGRNAIAALYPDWRRAQRQAAQLLGEDAADEIRDAVARWLEDEEIDAEHLED